MKTLFGVLAIIPCLLVIPFLTGAIFFDKDEPIEESQTPFEVWLGGVAVLLVAYLIIGSFVWGMGNLI